MSNYIELIHLSSQITDEICSDFLPLNSFQLAKKLGISVRNSEDYHHDWKGKIAPVRLKNAFLMTTDDGYTIYYNESDSSYNFYIAHEIAHYLLKHNKDSIKQENDANLLALLLIAPPDRLKQMNRLSSKDIANLCKISNQLADQYYMWLIENEAYCEKQLWPKIIKSTILKNKYKYLVVILVVAIFSSVFTINHQRQLKNAEASALQPVASQTVSKEQTSIRKANSIVYITAKGKKYHLPDCRYIRDRKDVKKITLKDAIVQGYEPCEVCRPDIDQ